jgi:hypothetical protein
MKLQSYYFYFTFPNNKEIKLTLDFVKKIA